jgi:N12 class adenine-specific DNA methylase
MRPFEQTLESFLVNEDRVRVQGSDAYYIDNETGRKTLWSGLTDAARVLRSQHARSILDVLEGVEQGQLSANILQDHPAIVQMQLMRTYAKLRKGLGSTTDGIMEYTRMEGLLAGYLSPASDYEDPVATPEGRASAEALLERFKEDARMVLRRQGKPEESVESMAIVRMAGMSLGAQAQTAGEAPATPFEAGALDMSGSPVMLVWDGPRKGMRRIRHMDGREAVVEDDSLDLSRDPDRMPLMEVTSANVAESGWSAEDIAFYASRLSGRGGVPEQVALAYMALEGRQVPSRGGRIGHPEHGNGHWSVFYPEQAAWVGTWQSVDDIGVVQQESLLLEAKALAERSGFEITSISALEQALDGGASAGDEVIREVVTDMAAVMRSDNPTVDVRGSASVAMALHLKQQEQRGFDFDAALAAMPAPPLFGAGESVFSGANEVRVAKDVMEGDDLAMVVNPEGVIEWISVGLLSREKQAAKQEDASGRVGDYRVRFERNEEDSLTHVSVLIDETWVALPEPFKALRPKNATLLPVIEEVFARHNANERRRQLHGRMANGTLEVEGVSLSVVERESGSFAVVLSGAQSGSLVSDEGTELRHSREAALELVVATAMGIEDGKTPLLSSDSIWTESPDPEPEVQEQPFPEVREMMAEYSAYMASRKAPVFPELQMLQEIMDAGDDPYAARTEDGRGLVAVVAGYLSGQLNPDARRERPGLMAVLEQMRGREQQPEGRQREFLEDGRWKAVLGDEVYLSIESDDTEVPVFVRGTVKGTDASMTVEVVNFAEASALLPIAPSYTYTSEWTVQGDPQVAERAAEAVASATLKRLAIDPEAANTETTGIVQTYRDVRTGRGYEVVSDGESEVVLRADDGEVLKESRADFLQFYSRYRKVSRRQQIVREEVPEEERDFHLGEAELKAPRGSAGRIRANIAAIALVKRLDSEGRMASPDEKKVLALYSGWGADKELFNDAMADMRERTWKTPQYESWEKRFGKYYDQLKELLTEVEWEAAKASTLNAHYTSEEVARAMWDIARRAGFEGGHVLDPGMGTGNLFATMPRDLHAKSRMTGVELDSITGAISYHLFPQADIHVTGFQDAPIANASVDMVIANIPFSDVPLAGQPKGEELNLHNFFISRSMDKLKPGGIGVIITSASTLENNAKQRELLAKKSQFIGAIRLPNDAFKGNTNTEVVTDILLLRKANEQAIDSEAWTRKVPVHLSEDGTFTPAYGSKIDTTEVNEYFYAHPEQVLGFHSLNGEMYGYSEKGQYTVVTPKGAPPLAERIAGAVANLPERIYGVIEDGSREDVNEEEMIAFRHEKVGSFVTRGESIYQVSPLKALGPLPWEGEEKPSFPRGFNEQKALDLIGDFITLRNQLTLQIRTDLNAFTTEAESEQRRGELREAYAAFTDKWGKLNANPSIYKLLKSDPECGAVFALERVSKERDSNGKTRSVITDAAILSERTLFAHHEPHVETIEEAISASQAERGYPDVEYIAELLGKDSDPEGIRHACVETGMVFEDPASGKLVSRTRYLSGNVVRKYNEARRAADDDPRFASNVEELEKVQPLRIPFSQISVNLSSTWVPSEIPSLFARTILEQGRSFGFEYLPVTGKWVALKDASYNSAVSSVYGTDEVRGNVIFEKAMNHETITVTYTDSDGKKHEDPKASAQANEKAERIREEYLKWLKDNDEARGRIEDIYNERLNNMVVPAYDGAHLKFPGMSRGSASMTPRKHQRDVVARIIEEQCGMIAHEVGYGKTFELILAAYESKRLGLCRKPMVVCDNPSYPQFVDTVRQVYPQANILVSDEESMNKRNRNQFLSSIASEAWDFVIVPQSHFDMMPVSPETEIRYLSTELNDLEEALRRLNEGQSERRLVRQIEKKKENAKQRILGLQKKLKERGDDCLTFEQLGVDMLFIDEAHKYKKMPFNTSHQRVKGIDTGQSQRGMNLLMKARFIQDRREGAGVVAATATPVTNTMAEVWNMIRLTQPRTLEEFGCGTFDEFISTFTTQETAMELNESNNKWRNITRLSKFINGPTFIEMVRSAFDVQMDKEAVGLDLPERKGGEIALQVIEQTDAVADLMDGISEIYGAYEQSGDKREISFVPIMLMQVSMAAAIDPRLINPEAEDDPTSLVNRMVGEVKRIYDATGQQRGAQAIFLDRYRPMDTSILETVKKGGLDAFRSQLDDNPDAEIKVVDKEAEFDEEFYDMREDLIKHRRADEGTEKYKIIMKMSRDEVEKAVAEIGWRKKFNLYNEIRDKLVAAGIPREEVAVIGECKNANERKDLFARINDGKCRVVMGSTSKLGTGVNIQKRLAAMHHVDPARDLTPASMNQRSGRGIRQGNIFDEVEEIYYGMKDTAVPGIYHRIQRKQQFIGQALAGRGVRQEFEDCSEVRLEEMKSALISDKRQIQRAELIARIKDEKMQAEVLNESIRRNEHTVGTYRTYIERDSRRSLPGGEAMAAHAAEHFPDLYKGTDEKGEEKELESCTVVLPMGDAITDKHSAVIDKLNEFIKECQDIRIDKSKVEEKVGNLKIGNMDVEITVANRYLDGTGGVVLRAAVKNPVGTGYLTEGKVHTGKGLLNIYTTTREYMLNRPEAVRKSIAENEATVAKLEAQRAEMQEYDYSAVTAMESELAALEEDMRNNPMQRRRRRDAVVEAEEVTQEPEPELVSADSEGPYKVRGKTPEI